MWWQGNQNFHHTSFDEFLKSALGFRFEAIVILTTSLSKDISLEMILNKKSINIVVAIQLVSAQITFNPKNFLIIAFCGYITYVR